jgi:hypothetical protein
MRGRLTKPFSGRGGVACQERKGFLIPRPCPASADGERLASLKDYNMQTRVFLLLSILYLCSCSSHIPLHEAGIVNSADPLESFHPISLGSLSKEGTFRTTLSNLEAKAYIIGIVIYSENARYDTINYIFNTAQASVSFSLVDEQKHFIINTTENTIILNAIHSNDKKRVFFWLSGYSAYSWIDTPVAKISKNKTIVDLEGASYRVPTFNIGKGWGSTFRASAGNEYHLVVKLEGVQFPSKGSMPEVVIIEGVPDYVPLDLPIT